MPDNMPDCAFGGIPGTGTAIGPGIIAGDIPCHGPVAGAMPDALLWPICRIAASMPDAGCNPNGNPGGITVCMPTDMSCIVPGMMLVDTLGIRFIGGTPCEIPCIIPVDMDDATHDDVMSVLMLRGTRGGMICGILGWGVPTLCMPGPATTSMSCAIPGIALVCTRGIMLLGGMSHDIPIIVSVGMDSVAPDGMICSVPGVMSVDIHGDMTCGIRDWGGPTLCIPGPAPTGMSCAIPGVALVCTHGIVLSGGMSRETLIIVFDGMDAMAPNGMICSVPGVMSVDMLGGTHGGMTCGI